MNNRFDAEYWNTRYQSNETGWDMGHPAPALMEYILGVATKESKILIPGCGQAWEGQWLWEHGFDNIWLADAAEETKMRFMLRVPDFPEEQFIVGDFFALNQQFDFILEQTFFCALDPHLRDRYVEKMTSLLEPHGRLAGVLFNFPLTEVGPPFGGSAEEYLERFVPHFEFLHLETCRNSIKPREGRELFFQCRLA